MANEPTIRVYESDKERLQEIADATDRRMADVVAEFIRDPDYLCPECGEPFSPEEIDADSLEYHGVLTTGVDKLVKGEKEVKSFACPCCDSQLKPSDVGLADDHEHDGTTEESLGLERDEEDKEDPEQFSAEEA